MGQKYVVLVGNPVTGFKVVGSFDSFDDACEWEDSLGTDSWVIELTPEY